MSFAWSTLFELHWSQIVNKLLSVDFAGSTRKSILESTFQGRPGKISFSVDLEMSTLKSILDSTFKVNPEINFRVDLARSDPKSVNGYIMGMIIYILLLRYKLKITKNNIVHYKKNEFQYLLE